MRASRNSLRVCYLRHMTRGTRYQSALLVFALAFAACGGSTPPAESAPESGPVVPDKTEVAPPSEDTPKAEEDAPRKKTPKEEVAEPTFAPDMSVDEAINAAKATERMNVDQETM